MPLIPERVSTIKPDGCFYHTASQETASYSYYDMAFPAEFKKCSGNANVIDVGPASSILFVPSTIHSQDTSKVLYVMRHMMAVDARRRFIFGLTIEDTCLRLWYANHSMLVSSVPLNNAQVATTSLIVFQHLSTSIGNNTLYPDLTVVCIRIRRGHGLRSICQACAG